jgi:long-chain acyl-CoA synthetase
MFNTAFAAKKMGLKSEGKLTHGLWDRILFNKIKKALGFDCVRLMVSGSAPLSPTVMIFFRCLLGVPVCEGYGQTEGSAAATIGHPADMASVGHVGGPHRCVDVVLVDVPEMNYLSSGKCLSQVIEVRRNFVQYQNKSTYKKLLSPFN